MECYENVQYGRFGTARKCGTIRGSASKTGKSGKGIVCMVVRTMKMKVGYSLI